MRPKKCPECRDKFQPTRQMQPCCDKDACREAFAIRHAESTRKRRQMQRAKADRIAGIEDRKAVKAKLETLKPLSKLAKEAEHWINRIARIRDKDMPCISCDRRHSWNGQWHASHYKSVGSNSALRFNLSNIHKACSICNNHLSGNIAGYARRLPDRIGMERFMFIENHPRERKYSREYLIRLKAVAMRWCKRLERRAANEMQN